MWLITISLSLHAAHMPGTLLGVSVMLHFNPCNTPRLFLSPEYLGQNKGSVPCLRIQSLPFSLCCQNPFPFPRLRKSHEQGGKWAEVSEESCGEIAQLTQGTWDARGTRVSFFSLLHGWELPLWYKDIWICELHCVQLIEFIIQHPNAEKNCLLCSLMSAIKTSGESNFMNDPLWLTW